MLFGIVVYGAGSFLCFIANSIEVLLVSRFIQAFGASAGSVVTQTILRESVEGHKRHVMFAQISAVIAFTPAIGPLIGGFLDRMFGFKIVFLSLVVMSIGIFLYTFVSLPETKTGSVTNKINVFSVLKRLITNPKVVTYGLLIGGANGVLFSYYAEAPFIFIEYFQLSPSMYGFLGIVVASASIVGAKISKRLLATYKPENYIYRLSCNDRRSYPFICYYVCGINPNVIYMVVFLIAMFILLLGIGVALPNCLSLALVDFQDVIGTAGALFSLGYYVIVAMTIWGMSQLHTGSLLVMPLYFLVIVVIMAVFTRVFIFGKQTSKSI